MSIFDELFPGHEEWADTRTDFHFDFDTSANNRSIATSVATDEAQIEDIYNTILTSVDLAWSISLQTAVSVDTIKDLNHKVLERLLELETNVLDRAQAAMPTLHNVSIPYAPMDWNKRTATFPKRACSLTTNLNAAAPSAGSPTRRLNAKSTISAGDQSPAVPTESAGRQTRPILEEQSSVTPRWTPDETEQSDPRDASSLAASFISPESMTSPSEDASPRPMKRVRLRNKDRVSNQEIIGGGQAVPARRTLLMDSKLAKKALQIGNSECVNCFKEFSVRLQDRSSRNTSNAAVDVYGFPSITQIRSGSEFLRMLPRLASVIESSIFGELDYRVRKRIALAHFFHAYTLAQNNPRTFLSWCDGRDIPKSLLPRGGYRSAVQKRFVDLMFPTSEQRSNTSALSDAQEVAKTRVSKIQMWRKNGKHWAALIRRFGYGLLLLVPPCLTDEDLRVAHDDEISALIDHIDSRKQSFANALTEANDLLRKHFLTQTSQCPLGSDGNSELESLDWSDFLRVPVNFSSHP